MHTAMRIDFARPYVGGTDARFFALALASGIAGLTVTYPTITLGNGTVGEWRGRFEVRPAHLAMGEILPETSVTAKFHDTAVIAAHDVGFAAAGLAKAFATGGAPMAGHSRTKAGPASPAQLVERPAPSANLAPSPSPASSGHGRAQGGRTLLAEHTPPATGNAAPTAPLDAVRIALPPASSELSTAGALPPQATLNSVASAQTPLPQPQSLAGSSPPPATPLRETSVADAQPFGLLSAAKDVREFDLARLGGATTRSEELMRTAANAIGAAKPVGRAGYLSNAPKVPDRVVGNYILHVAGLSLDGVPSGNLSVRIGMGGDLSVKLADLLVPVQDQMAPETFQRLANSATAAEYVSFAQLRAAGFDIRYDAGSDRLMVSAQL